MKISNIPFNMNFTENKELKEVPEDIEDMKKGINFLLDELDKNQNSLEEAGVQSLLGIFNMMIGSVDEALYYLEEAEKNYSSLNKSALAFVAKIRTAVVLMWMGKFGNSYDILHECLKIAKSTKNKNIKSMIDRIYIDIGKLKFFQKEYTASLDYFVKAMDVRVANGNIEKINHVKHLLVVVGKKIDNR